LCLCLCKSNSEIQDRPHRRWPASWVWWPNPSAVWFWNMRDPHTCWL